MTVVTLIMILASISIPYYQTIVRRAHETVLRQDLFTMRKQIDLFTHDNGRAPASLEELVRRKVSGTFVWDAHTDKKRYLTLFSLP